MQIPGTDKLSKQSNLTLFMFTVLIGLSIIFTFVVPGFLDATNLRNVLIRQSALLIVGLSVTFLMVTGHFDLSVGSVMAMGGVLTAYFCQYATGSGTLLGNGLGLSVRVAIPLALLCCAFVGLINAFFIVRVKVASVIVTLGTMAIAKGVANIIARGAARSNGLPPEFTGFANTHIGSISLPLLITIVLVAIFIFVEKKTVFGRINYYIGANLEVSRLSGISTGQQITILYLVSAILAGLSGIILASKFNAGMVRVGNGYEFTAVIATVLGGTSIMGGRGTVIGLIIGVYIIGLLDNGLNLIGMLTGWQGVASGTVIVIAILAQRMAMEKMSS
jgi:ribose transport system permease protein